MSDRIFAINSSSDSATTTVTKPKVYICHSGQDRMSTAQIVGDLKLAGADVWVDYERLSHSTADPELASILSEKDYVILVQSPTAVASPGVESAMNLAANMRVNNQLKEIIPVLVADCSGVKVPALWDSLHRYDATDNYLRAIRGLIKAICLDPSVIESRPDLPSVKRKTQYRPHRPDIQKVITRCKSLPPSVFGLIIGVVAFLILVWALTTFWPH